MIMSKVNHKFKYTLIIPHFNIPHLLKRLLSTVPRRNDLQVIVVDDMSTKDLDKLEELKKEYDWVEWYDTGINGGGGKARNIGLRHAKGDYILFADSDDKLLQNAYQVWNNAIDNIKDHNPIDIIYFKSLSFDENNDKFDSEDKKAKNIERLKKRPFELEKFLRYNVPQPWSKLFKLEFLKKNNIIFEESKVANDYRFSVLTGLAAKNIKFIETSFYNYVRRSDSLSYNDTETLEKIYSRLNVFYNVEILFKNNNIRLRPFSRYISNLKKSLDSKSFNEIINYINKNFKYKYTINKITSYIYQLPRKFFEVFNLPYSGIK